MIKHFLIFLFAGAMSLAAYAQQPAWVILTAGQSNTDGRVDNALLPDEIQRGGYHYCQWSFGSGAHSGEGRFETFFPRIYNKNKPGRWAYDAVVYYAMEQWLQRPFYVIKESLGGTAIDTLCRSTNNMHWSADSAYLARTAASDKGGLSLLRAFTDNIGACIDNQLSALPEGYEIGAMLWHQGESDRSQADHYYDNLKGVVAYVRAYLVQKTGRERYARLPFICGTFSSKSKQGSPLVVEALRRLEREDPDFHVVDAGDATLQADQIHFDAVGAELLGRRMADTLRAVLVSAEQKNRVADVNQPCVARYFGNRVAAISYTFDDGLLEHYTKVFPKLREYGFKATFAVIGCKVGGEQKGTPCMTWRQLREMAAEGQEITNHGFQHKNVTTLSADDLWREVQRNDTLILDSVGQFPRTYFYPGNRKSEETIAICGKDRVGTRVRQVDVGSRRDSVWLRHWLRDLLSRGEWGVTMTHGITVGYDAFRDADVLWSHFRQVFDMQDSIWVATFHDVSAYRAERDAVSLAITAERNRMVVVPAMPLDAQLFNHPLTLVLPDNVRSARQGRRTLNIYSSLGRKCVDFNPHGKPVQLKINH